MTHVFIQMVGELGDSVIDIIIILRVCIYVAPNTSFTIKLYYTMYNISI